MFRPLPRHCKLLVITPDSNAPNQKQENSKNMAVDLTKVNAAIGKLTNEVTRLQGLVPSIQALLSGQAEAIKTAVQAAVAEALAKEGQTNQPLIDAIADTVDTVAAQFDAEGDKLADAVAANTPPTGPPTEPPTEPSERRR